MASIQLPKTTFAVLLFPVPIKTSKIDANHLADGPIIGDVPALSGWIVALAGVS
jgi:hypothetical protein